MILKGLLVKIYAKLISIVCNSLTKGIDSSCFECPTLNKIIYHKNLSDFPPRYPNTHLGNALLVDDTPYKTCQNPPCNVIFVESYEDVKEEYNYLLWIFFHTQSHFIILRLMFPPLWRIILLVSLEVSQKMMSNFRRLKNAPLPITPISIEIN